MDDGCAGDDRRSQEDGIEVREGGQVEYGGQGAREELGGRGCWSTFGGSEDGLYRVRCRAAGWRSDDARVLAFLALRRLIERAGLL